MNYDDEMTERAVGAYTRRLAMSGCIVDQPSSSRSHRRGNTVTLANVNGQMARYRVGKHKSGAEFIRFLPGLIPA